jgi:hypothetical protein
MICELLLTMILQSSYKLLKNFFLLKLPMNFLQTSYELPTNFFWISYELPTNFLWASYKHPTNFLWDSYKILMSFLQTSNELLSNFLRKVLRTPYKLLTRKSWLTESSSKYQKIIYKICDPSKVSAVCLFHVCVQLQGNTEVSIELDPNGLMIIQEKSRTLS